MENLVYLDNSATSYPKPEEMHDYMCHFYRNYGVNPGRSGYDMAIQAEEMVVETRKLLTEFFNGDDYNRLVFTYNASDSLNMIIKGILKPEDHVITTRLEHNSVLRPLYHLRKKVDMTYVKFDAEGYVDPDDFKKALKSNTKLVIINHGSNVIGTVQPIKEIGEICRKANVPFAIDASQTAGMIPIDIQEQNVDIVAFTGHKSMYGPTGIGGLYVSQGIDIEPTRQGGTGVKSAVRTHLYEYPYRLECGTMNLMGVAGLNGGNKFITRQGLDNIHIKEMKLYKKLRDGFQNIDGVKIYCADPKNDDKHLPVVSINIDGYTAFDVGMILDVDFNIATRTGLHCAPLVHEDIGTAPKGAVRFSIGYFNTEEDIDHAINSVKKVAEEKLIK